MSSPIKLHNKAEVSNTLNPSAGRETSKSAAMGFTSSISVARTTRFKRKLATAFTPPATPFNNTSFLMHLQQKRERHNHRPYPTQISPFDQYGSMDTFIARSFATTPASPLLQLRHRTTTTSRGCCIPVSVSAHAHKTPSAPHLNRRAPAVQTDELAEVSPTIVGEYCHI